MPRCRNDGWRELRAEGGQGSLNYILLKKKVEYSAHCREIEP
jgi:hypothetical protein